MAKETWYEKWTSVMDELSEVEQKNNKEWNERNKPLKEIQIDENQVMGFWYNPIGGYYYGYRYKKGIYQERSVMRVPRQLSDFIIEHERALIFRMGKQSGK